MLEGKPLVLYLEGWTWQVREYTLCSLAHKAKEWERPMWWDLSYFFRQSVVPWSSGLNALCHLGAWGERGWRESGSTPSRCFSIPPRTSASFLVPDWLPQYLCQCARGQGRPLLIGEGRDYGEGKIVPLRNKKVWFLKQKCQMKNTSCIDDQ